VFQFQSLKVGFFHKCVSVFLYVNEKLFFLLLVLVSFPLLFQESEDTQLTKRTNILEVPLHYQLALGLR
jgi:hypothetical protein